MNYEICMPSSMFFLLFLRKKKRHKNLRAFSFLVKYNLELFVAICTVVHLWWRSLPKGISSQTCALITYSSSSALPTAFHFSLLLPSPPCLSQLSSPPLYFHFTHIRAHRFFHQEGFFFSTMFTRGNICTNDGFSTNPKRNTLFQNELHTLIHKDLLCTYANILTLKCTLNCTRSHHKVFSNTITWVTPGYKTQEGGEPRYSPISLSVHFLS